VTAVDRLPADLFLTALFRAAGLGLAAVALAPAAGVDAPRDGILLVALAAAAVLALLARAVLRREEPEARAVPLAVLLTALAVAVIACAHRTGGLASPLVVVLGGVALLAAYVLPPLPHFLSLGVLCLAHTAMTVAMARTGPVDPEASALLVVELGLTVLAAGTLNGLATARTAR